MSELMNYLRPVILAAGFLFILAGLNILIIENPSYESSLSWLYTLILYTFYLYILFLFLNVLIAVLKALLALLKAKQ